MDLVRSQALVFHSTHNEAVALSVYVVHNWGCCHVWKRSTGFLTWKQWFRFIAKSGFSSPSSFFLLFSALCSAVVGALIYHIAHGEI
jgi:hypothetical protein